MTSPLVIWQLTDEKPGHESQTRGLIGAMTRRAPVDVHRIVVRSSHRAVLQWAAKRFPPGTTLPRPHLILCCGHITHLPALAARRSFGGRCIALMKPSLPLSWFDLCLIPEHDGVEPRRNVIATRGVLNPIVPAPWSNERTDRGLFLIGGPSSHHGWNGPELMNQIRDVIQRDSSRTWILTTSRRTPTEFVDLLRIVAAEHSSGPEPRLQVIPYEQTPRGWVAEQLGQVGTALVTEDSVSMIYESLTAGVVVGLLDMPRLGSDRVIEGVQKLLRGGFVVKAEGALTAQAPSRETILAEADRCAEFLLRGTSQLETRAA